MRPSKRPTTSGRINGLYNWRLGWRADVLRRRQANPEEPNAPLAPPSMPHDTEPRPCLSDLPHGLQQEAAWEWWSGVCGSPRYVAGPMIGQSERAFRLLCRSAGAGLCYTPMYLCDDVCTGAHDDELIGNCDEALFKQDRPLICQLAGNDATSMLRAALRVQAHCDAIDVNLGCPQRCAELGNYGSYFLEADLESVCGMIATLCKGLTIPVTAKMRLQREGIEHTIHVARRLERAGVSALCVHGRLRDQREHDGPADWAAVRAIKCAVGIPVICNGSIQSGADASTCLQYTGADAVMGATGLLRNPNLFLHKEPMVCSCHITPDCDAPENSHVCGSILSSIQSCRDYIGIAKECWNYKGFIGVNGKDKVSVVRSHLMAMLQCHLMGVHMEVWSLLASNAVSTLPQFAAILCYIENRVLPCADTKHFSLHQIKVGDFCLLKKNSIDTS